MTYYPPEKLEYRRPDFDPPVHLTWYDVDHQLLLTAPDELDHQRATRILCSIKGEAGMEQTFAYLKKKFPDRKVPRAFIVKLADTQDSRLPKAIKTDPRTLTERIRAKVILKIFGKN
jgi:hypothetical protein